MVCSLVDWMANRLSMMEDPHVQVMAGKLRDCLERALQALNSPAMLHL
jgi:hypothetical protein